MKRRFIALVAVFCASPFAACVDTSPLSFHEQEAGVSDGAVGDGAVIRKCRECIAGDGAPCRPEYDSCTQAAKCPPALDCLLDTGCFEFANFSDRIKCGLPCLQAQGVFSGTDPATTALGQINVCIVASCSKACFVK